MATVRVQRLALRATRRDAIGRTMPVVEDAFRTASLNGVGAGEIVLVRRLDLGLIRLGAPSQTLALRIEAALRGITPLRLRAGDVAPPDAPAISFHDRAEALAALLIAARRGALRGWWWARLLPAAAQSTLPVLMPAALAAAVREGGFTLVAAMISRLIAMQELDAALAAAPDDAVARALSLVGLASTPQRVTTSGQAELIEQAPVSGPGAVAAARAHAIASALPSMWRDAVRRSAADGNRSDPRPLLVVAAALSEIYGPAAVDAAPAVLGVFAEQAESPAPPIAHATVRASSPESSLPPLAAPATESSQRATQSQSSEIASLRSGEAPPQTIPSAWRSTRHAGLLFLIPAFAQLGLDTLDPRQGDLPLRLLRFLAARLRIRPEDAALDWLPAPLPEPARARFVAPRAWERLLGFDTLYIRRIGTPGRRALTDARGRVLAGLIGPGDLARREWPLRRAAALRAMDAEARLMTGLTLALSRLLRRRGKISLRRLVRRPGLVRASATHLELRIDARFIDIGVRRAALDLDPGFVPWLGKVVTFHYHYGEDQ